MTNALELKLSHYVRLSDGDRRTLCCALGRVRTARARTDIANEDDEPLALNVIMDGWACRARQFADGRKLTISLLLPGDFYLVRPNCIGDAISALTDVSYARIPFAMLQDLTARSPYLDLAFRREAFVTAAIQREWTVSLGCRSGIERLAHLFCELRFRLAAVGLADQRGYLLPLTQIGLAHALGQTSVHINRTLRELRDQGLITLQSRRLTIHDRARLAELAHFDPAYLHLGANTDPLP